MRHYCAKHSREHCQMCPKEEEPVMIGNWPANMVPGEVKTVLNAEHLCNSCFMAPVCKINDAIDEGMLTVISRCAMHVDPGAPDG